MRLRAFGLVLSAVAAGVAGMACGPGAEAADAGVADAGHADHLAGDPCRACYQLHLDGGACSSCATTCEALEDAWLNVVHGAGTQCTADSECTLVPRPHAHTYDGEECSLAGGCRPEAARVDVDADAAASIGQQWGRMGCANRMFCDCGLSQEPWLPIAWCLSGACVVGNALGDAGIDAPGAADAAGD
jgi:hypothetical protein